MFTAGDAHGDVIGILQAILALFEHEREVLAAGSPLLPVLVLLGDLLDRGNDQCLVLHLAFCAALALPGRAFLIQGNHELPLPLVQGTAHAQDLNLLNELLASPGRGAGERQAGAAARVPGA